MALRYSNGARSFLAADGSFKDMFHNGKIEIYSGAQPASANAAVTGVLLATITNSSLARTAEVLSTGSVTLTGGAAGSFDTLTVNGVDILGGAVPFNTSLNQTAADIVAQCEARRSSTDYELSAAGAIITITARPGTGVTPNGFVVASTVTTITKTDANMAGGVTSVNGLLWGAASAGVLAKVAAQTWSGVNAATGTAGYYRMYGSVADAGGLDSAGTTLREDGSVLTTGGELNMASTTLTATATTTITAWQRTIPTA